MTDFRALCEQLVELYYSCEGDEPISILRELILSVMRALDEVEQ